MMINDNLFQFKSLSQDIYHYSDIVLATEGRVWGLTYPARHGSRFCRGYSGFAVSSHVIPPKRLERQSARVFQFVAR